MTNFCLADTFHINPQLQLHVAQQDKVGYSREYMLLLTKIHHSHDHHGIRNRLTNYFLQVILSLSQHCVSEPQVSADGMRDEKADRF